MEIGEIPRGPNTPSEHYQWPQGGREETGKGLQSSPFIVMKFSSSLLAELKQNVMMSSFTSSLQVFKHSTFDNLGNLSLSNPV